MTSAPASAWSASGRSIRAFTIAVSGRASAVGVKMKLSSVRTPIKSAKAAAA
jgi:hypothetical protein